MAQVTSGQPFAGQGQGPGQIINAAVSGGPATLEMQVVEGTWVPVPNGTITDSAFSFFAPVSAVFRFTFASGTVAIFR